MKTIKFLSYSLFVLFLSISISSCSGDDGSDGATGPAGTNGQDGTDGNANVQTYVYNTPSWEPSGSAMHIDMTGILTDDVIANDAVLVYTNHTTSIGDRINIIPGSVWNSNYRDYSIFLRDSNDNNPFSLSIVSLEMNGSFTPNANLWAIKWVKVIIIESENTTTVTGNGARPTSSKQRVYSELENAGIDANDYYAVCEYYGINPE